MINNQPRSTEMNCESLLRKKRKHQQMSRVCWFNNETLLLLEYYMLSLYSAQLCGQMDSQVPNFREQTTYILSETGIETGGWRMLMKLWSLLVQRGRDGVCVLRCQMA